MSSAVARRRPPIPKARRAAPTARAAPTPRAERPKKAASMPTPAPPIARATRWRCAARPSPLAATVVDRQIELLGPASVGRRPAPRRATRPGASGDRAGRRPRRAAPHAGRARRPGRCRWGAPRGRPGEEAPGVAAERHAQGDVARAAGARTRALRPRPSSWARPAMSRIGGGRASRAAQLREGTGQAEGPAQGARAFADAAVGPAVERPRAPRGRCRRRPRRRGSASRRRADGVAEGVPQVQGAPRSALERVLGDDGGFVRTHSSTASTRARPDHAGPASAWSRLARPRLRALRS